MASLLRLVIPFLLFPAASAIANRFAPASLKLKLFAMVNILGAFGLCLVSPMTGLYFWQLPAYLGVAITVFGIYLVVVLVHYGFLRAYSQKSGWAPWNAFFFPIAVMLAVKCLPAVADLFHGPLAINGKKTMVEFFVGISYMAFRLSRLVLEVRNKVVPTPTIWEYLSFAFFVPTLAVGPISRYSVFRESLYNPNRKETPLRQSILRTLVGLTKYLFLASVIEQLSYRGLLLDGHPHAWIDLPIAAVAFYLFLYLNFSGYCDMAVGTAGLIGIRIDENFNAPFRSRNIQEFWTRWHITLSSYMRDTVFSPLSKVLIRQFGSHATPHAIAISSFAVFVAIGAWHGLAWNFLIFGALHGLGIVSYHYYTIWLKKRLGKLGYSAYINNRLVRAAAISVTFLFVAGTEFFFANSLDAARAIMKILR